MKTKLYKTLWVVVAVAGLLSLSAAQAETITNDFESYTATAVPGSDPRNGDYTNLTFIALGLTMDITRPDGGRFDIIRNTFFDAPRDQTKPAAWGLQSLDPFYQQTSPTIFVVNFSLAVTEVSVLMGDYGDDAGDLLALRAYSGLGGTGSLLDVGTATLPMPGTTFDARWLTVSTTDTNGIRSVTMVGGTQYFPNSVFYDEVIVTFNASDPGGDGDNIPEPSTYILVGIGLAMLAGKAWRKRQTI